MMCCFLSQFCFSGQDSVVRQKDDVSVAWLATVIKKGRLAKGHLCSDGVSFMLYFFLQAVLRAVTVPTMRHTAPLPHTTRAGGWDHLWAGPVAALVTEALSTVTALRPNTPLRPTLPSSWFTASTPSRSTPTAFSTSSVFMATSRG